MTPIIATLRIGGTLYAAFPVKGKRKESDCLKLDENGKLVKVSSAEVFALLGKKESKQK